MLRHRRCGTAGSARDHPVMGDRAMLVQGRPHRRDARRRRSKLRARMRLPAPDCRRPSWISSWTLGRTKPIPPTSPVRGMSRRTCSRGPCLGRSGPPHGDSKGKAAKQRRQDSSCGARAQHAAGGEQGGASNRATLRRRSAAAGGLGCGWQACQCHCVCRRACVCVVRRPFPSCFRCHGGGAFRASGGSHRRRHRG